MTIDREEQNGVAIATVHSDEVVLRDAQSALDFMMTLQYETGCSRIALNKEAVIEEFFTLRTGLAGEMLQKFVNYRVKLALYGDFSGYTSKPLRDFIEECNRGKHVFFQPTLADAVARLAAAPE